MQPRNDLDAIIAELNQNADSRSVQSDAQFGGWIRHVVAAGGSDLFLVTGSRPTMRLHGSLVAIADDLLDQQDIETAIIPLLPRHATEEFRQRRIVDSSIKLDAIGRLRVNLHQERGHTAAAIRVLPARVPKLSELGLPPQVEGLTRLSSGLVLISGATGSGKTTTLAALVDAINRRDARHIITVEDPIEYEHANQLSLIEQVEVGVDAPDFPTALRAAVRQAPDVLVIGEMRDHESMRIALAAAETGHLVLSSVHSLDVASSVGRICDSFPNERQNTIRQELSWALAAVMTQTLIPLPAKGRVPAAELLMISYGARQHIRKNALQHLHQEITITRKLGSFTLEESLVRLVKTGAITTVEAQSRSRHPDEIETLLK